MSVVALALLVSSEIRAQEPPSARAATQLGNGVHVAFKTEYVASKPATGLPGQNRFLETRVEAESNVVHRVLMDSATGSYFGYELEVEPMKETKQFKVTVKALSPEFLQRLREESVSRKSARQQGLLLFELQLPRFPQPQIIDDGDTLALDVLVNRQTGVKIVDLITVSTSGAPLPEPSSSAGPARDFQVENVQLKVWNYQLLLNGQSVARSTGGCYGRLIYFYLPGRGRFVFSIAPQEGFQKIGVIEQNKISFSVGGDTYEWISGPPIIEAGGNWNLWVLHEPDYRPNLGRFSSVAAQTFGIGAADDVKALYSSAKKD
jgi:hypothetical protein